MTTRVNFRLSLLATTALLLSAFSVSAQTIAKKSNIKLINAREHILKAIEYHEDKEYAKADKIYSEIPKSDSLYHLALYERALTAYTLEKYDDAIAFCLEGLTLREGKSNFYGLLGNVYDDKKMSQKAIETFNEGLKQFPYNQRMHFNLGVVYYRIDSLNQAEDELIQALKLNPFHFRSHYYLGMLNERKGKMVEALLCYYTASVLQPQATDAVAQLMKYLNGESELVSLADKYSGSGNEKLPQFERLEEIISSKIALNPKYKTKARINEISVKQGQMLFDKLVYDPKLDYFYMNFYVPFFINIREEGFYEPFFYSIFSGFDNREIQSWLSTRQGKLTRFGTSAVEKIAEMRKTGLVNLAMAKDTIFYVYNGGDLSSFGHYSDKKRELKTGLWTGVHGNGGMNWKMEYVNNKEDGLVITYNSEGVKSFEYSMKNGQLNGPYLMYHDNGVKSREGSTVEGSFEGSFKSYYPSGQLQAEGSLKEKELNGPKMTYFLDGTLANQFNYINGKLDGEVFMYYSDGTMSEKYSYAKEELHGPYESYYPNKTIRTKGTYEKGKSVGKWIGYFANGVISSENTYNSKGENIDTTREYYPDGKLMEETVYTSTKSINTFYDRNGKKYYKTISDKEKTLSYEAYNPEGKVIDKAEISAKTLNYKKYNAQGLVTVEGKIVNNKYDGIWTYYNANGLKVERRSIKNGEYHGNDSLFWENGALKKILPYKNGKLDGYYEEYHINGSIAREGWYVEDNEQGMWKEYNIDGTIENVNYYANGDFQGWQDYYYPNGKLKEQNFYEYDYYSYKVLYDTLGKAYYTKRLENGNGQYELVALNGTKTNDVKMIGGNFYGDQKMFYANGAPRMTGKNINDRYFGKVNRFDEDGVLESATEYINNQPWGPSESYTNGSKSYSCNNINGDLYGAAKWYYPNGKLECEFNYLDNVTDGKATYYAPDGQVMIVLNFNWGSPVSYTYKDKAGNFVAPIAIGKDSVHVVAYYQNGTKSVDYYYLNGIKTGNIEYYFPNGKIYSKLYRIGNMEHGLSIENYANGNPLTVNNYYYGYLHGVCKDYYENGTLRSDELYNYGYKHGISKYYDSKGKLTKTRTYFYGTMVSETKI